MNKRHCLLLALPFAALLGGCVIAVGDGDGNISSSWERAERENREEIAQLNLNLSVASVRERLGKPDFSEAYKEGDAEVLVLFYRTQHQHEDGITTKDECTPLVFKGGLLSGWGDKVYAQASGGPL